MHTAANPCRLEGCSHRGGGAPGRTGGLQGHRFGEPHHARAREEQAVRAQPTEALAA